MSEVETSSFAKIGAAVGFAVTVTLIALTASLPLNLPSHQSSTLYNGDGVPHGTVQSDSSDIAVTIPVIIFFFLLPTALTYLYGVLYNSDLDKLIRLTTITAAVLTSTWVVMTFSLTAGKDSRGHGIIGLPKTFYMYLDTSNNTAGLNGYEDLPNSLYATFLLFDMLLTAFIIAASVSDRVNIPGFVFFIFAWQFVVWAPVAHIVWAPSGYFYTNAIRDWCGGIVVHMVAAVTAVVVHLLLGHSTIPKVVATKEAHSVLLPTFAVWFLWFGFTQDFHADAVNAQAVANTFIAGTTTILLSYFIDMMRGVISTQVSLSNAILVGLIAVTPAAGFVTIGGAMVIVTIAYFVTLIIGAISGEGASPNSPFSILTLHGAAGTTGFIFTALISYEFINPDGENGLTYGRGIPIARHIAASLAIWGVVAFVNVLLFFFCNVICPIGIAGPVESKPVATSEPAGDVEVVDTGKV